MLTKYIQLKSQDLLHTQPTKDDNKLTTTLTNPTFIETTQVLE